MAVRQVVGPCADIDLRMRVVNVIGTDPELHPYIEGDPLVTGLPKPTVCAKQSLPLKENMKMIELDLGLVHPSADLDIEALASIALCSGNEMTLLSLSEALKCRGIGVGPALESYLLKPIQQYLFRTLKQCPIFKVSTTPITADLVTEMFGGFDVDIPFNSGDYDDATNEMMLWASARCVEGVLKRMELDKYYPNLYKLAIRSLTENLVVYRNRFKKG